MPQNSYDIPLADPATPAPRSAASPGLAVPQNPGARQVPAAPAAPATGGPVRRYGHGRRTTYGLLWAGWTAVLTIGGFAGLFGGQVLTGMVALALAVVAGYYDYRIWTWQARRLLFLIIW